MPTHALGAGTCNVSVNVPVTWRQSLGRVALAHDVSMGGLLRGAFQRLIKSTAELNRDASAGVRAARADNDEALALLERAVREKNSKLIGVAMEHIRRSASRMHSVAETLTGASCVALFTVGLGAAMFASAAGENELRSVARVRASRRRDEQSEVAA